MGPDEGGGAGRREGFDEHLRYQLKFLDFAPILHISAKTGERAPKLLETIEKVSARARARACRPASSIASSRRSHGASAGQPGPGATCGCLYAAQTGVAPPSFVLFTNVATKLHFSYERFLENRLRDEYGFFGTPIRITVRRRAEHRGRAQADRARSRVGRDQPATPIRITLTIYLDFQPHPITQIPDLNPDHQVTRSPDSPLLTPVRLYCRAGYVSMAAPKREWFKAAEVCEVAEVQPYMLRSWEAEFPKLGGRRRRRTAAVPTGRRRDGAAHQVAGVRRGPDAGRGAAPARGR